MKYKTMLYYLLLTAISLLNSKTSIAHTLYKEHLLTLNTGITAIACQPEVEQPVPTVLMLHGFASSKNEVGDLYKRLAKSLCENGIGSLRIDFRGWGDSELNMQESSIDTMVADAETAYHYLQTQSWVSPDRMGIIGFSTGGGISIVTASEHPNRYKSMVTWSSDGDFHKDFLLQLGQKNFDQAERKGSVNIDLGWRKITLGKDLFTSLDHYKLSNQIKKYPGAYLAIAGSEDSSSAYTKKYVASAAGNNKKAMIIPGADHIYGVLTNDQTTAEQVIDTTTNWFKDSL